MARIVPDTNVLVSAVIGRGRPRQCVHLMATGSDTLVTSPALVAEFVEVLSREKFQLSAEEILAAVDAIVGLAEIVHPSSKVDTVREDPEDNEVLAAALDGRAELILSGDPHLLGLRAFRGIPILSPAEYLSARGP